MNKEITPYKNKAVHCLIVWAGLLFGVFLTCGQDRNYTGEYEIVSGPGRVVKVFQEGTTVKMIYRGNTYETTLDGTTLKGFSQQDQSWVGDNAVCYQHILSDPEKAKTFRKALTVTFGNGQITGSIRIPKFICGEDESVQMMPGEVRQLKLSKKPNDLYWITDKAIFKCNVGDRESKIEIIGDLKKGYNIVLDEGGSILFYQDGDTIYSANSDGTNRTKLITAPEHASIRHLAVDGKENILFWSENYAIYRFDYPDGNVRRKQILKQQHPTHWLALDTEHQKIYWTSHYTDSIYRSNYTGRDTEYFTTDTADYINIDTKNRILYGADYKGVRAINLDSGISKEVIDASDYKKKDFNDPKEFYFDKDFNRLYFLGDHELYKANNKNYRVLDTKLGYFWHVFGLALVTGKPNLESIDPDVEFDIWTLIRQE